ncbi:MAG: 7-cyano-7-deazaguanine synthase QueC [Rickettsiales bacterium]
MSSSRRAVLLLSGGLDSSTVLGHLAAGGYEVYALSLNYGQRDAFELESARRVVAHYADCVKEHSVMASGLGALGGSALTDFSLSVPKRREMDMESAPISLSYVPARNTIFLSYALALAETRKAYDIFIGANHIDYSGYPDCRPEYLDAFETMANLALADTVENRGKIRVIAPLLRMNKAQIVEYGTRLGVPYALTHSCYSPYATGAPCGECDSCLLRRKGFEKAGMVDPLHKIPETA